MNDRLPQQIQTIGDIVANVHERLFHRLAHQSVGGKVHHRLDIVGVERGFDGGPVGQLPLNEGRLGVDGRPVTVVQIIENDDLVALPDQFLGDDAADIAGAASDQDFHVYLLGSV